MRSPWLMLAGLLLAIAPLAQAEVLEVLETQVTGTIEVGPDGHVVDYRLDNKLTKAVAEAVGANIRLWRFEPVLVDGRAVIAKTRLRLQLEAELEGDSYLLRVGNVWFGEPERAHAMAAPSYPTVAANAGVGGKVVLVLRLDDEGNVSDVHAEQTSLSIAPDTKRADRFRRLFENASMTAARGWKFRTGEMVNGEPIGGSVRIPVQFELGNGRWARYIPGPTSPAPWISADSLASAGASDPAEGEMQPLDSRLKLRTEVIGMIL